MESQKLFHWKISVCAYKLFFLEGTGK